MVTRGLSRDRLVEIAHAFVASHGLDALTVRRIAVAAEVSPGALYRHVRDKRDLQRAMADAVHAAVDLSGIDVASPSTTVVIECCVRIRAGMLEFRDGGRIVAGSYSPFAGTARIAETLRALLAPITLPPFDAGDLAYALRNYTVGFVVEEQAYLALVADGEWDDLVASLPRSADDGPSSGAAILAGDRDVRFRAGLTAILTGTVADPPRPR